MDIFKPSFAPPALQLQFTHKMSYWALVLLSFFVIGIALPVLSPPIGIASVAILAAMLWVAISFINDRVDVIALLWVAIFPYCYYFLSFPREHAIFTLDRAFLGTIIIYICVNWKDSVLPVDIKISGYLWGVFLAICCISLIIRPPTEILFTYRQFIDGLLIPPFLALYVLCYFPFARHIYKLHTFVCLLAIGISSIALTELFTGQDLLPWTGSEPYVIGSVIHVRRADGPFENSAVLALVSLFALFFIAFMRQLLPPDIPIKTRMLHAFGIFASILAALSPLDRGLIFALVPIAVIDCFSSKRLLKRKTWIIFFSCLLLAAFILKSVDPVVYEDRTTDPQNLFQRVAEVKETFHVIRDYPFWGVGFGNYHDFVTQSTAYIARWQGVESMTVQHNLLTKVLSEEGLIGLFFYLASIIFLLRASWRMRHAAPLGWKLVLYCFLAYFIVGLDVDIFSPSDLNLFFMFVIGLALHFQLHTANQISIVEEEQCVA